VGSFIFYKVALDASFYLDVTVIASLLMGVMTTTTVYASSSFYATQSGAYLARKRLGEGSGFFGPAFSIWVVTALVDVVLAKLLVFGFSKRLNANLGGSLFFSVSRIEETLLFSAIVATPLVLHLVMVIYATNTHARNLEKSPLSNNRNTGHPPDDSKTEKNSALSAGIFSTPLDERQLANIADGVAHAKLASHPGTMLLTGIAGKVHPW
jgi:hypothetical protein